MDRQRGAEELVSNLQDLGRDDRVRAWQIRAPGGPATSDEAGGSGDGEGGAASDEDSYVIVSLPVSAGQWQRDLTDAELDIALWILQGESNKRIAERRGTSVRTVANQIAGIYQKLGVTSRAELAARTTRGGRALR